jgi:ribosome-binding protein aMBF1 (putative translation factor)
VYGYTSLKQKINPDTDEPFESLTQYQEYVAMQRENPETGELFESISQYKQYLSRQRQKREENQQLIYVIRRRLTELGQTQNWLAEQLGITHGSVSKYVTGNVTPRKHLQKRLFKALGFECETLDDMLEAYS